MLGAPIRRETSARRAPVAPDPTMARRPCRARHPSGSLAWSFGQTRSDHAVSGDEVRKAFFAPAFRAGRAHRHYQIANLRSGVPDANVGPFGQLKTKIA